MQEDVLGKRINFLVNVFYFAVIIVLAFLFLKYLFFIFLPFILALGIALTVDPLTKLLCEKLKFRRSAAGTVAVLGFWGVLSFLIFKLLAVIIDELKLLYSALPTLLSKIPLMADDLINKYKNLLDKLPKPISENSSKITDAINSSLEPLTKNLGNIVMDTISYTITGLPNFLIFLAVCLVASTFIAADLPKYTRFIVAQVPLSRREAVKSAKNFLSVAIFKFLRAQVILIFITFCELCVGFSLLKIPYAILIAAVVSLVDVLPIIGTNTVVIPWGIIVMLNGDIKGGLLLILLSVTVSVVRQIIEPRILGHHLGLNPLLTLMCVYVGLQLFGLIGMLALPLALMFFKHMQETGYLKIWNIPKKDTK